MKVAYILTSSGTDFFFEQTILSIYSLRQHNPNMDVVVLQKLLMRKEIFMILVLNQ